MLIAIVYVLVFLVVLFIGAVIGVKYYMWYLGKCGKVICWDKDKKLWEVPIAKVGEYSGGEILVKRRDKCRT